jgi:hypothetical protein
LALSPVIVGAPCANASETKLANATAVTVNLCIWNSPVYRLRKRSPYRVQPAPSGIIPEIIFSHFDDRTE